MCRFVLYRGSDITLGSLVTEPSNSLIHQSFDNQEREEPLNGDGFGLAWYVPELAAEPALFRSVSPAWSNQNLRHLARVTRSRCILAHVRAATPGLPVAELNCHPFGWGPFAFMHNGHVGGFRQLRRRLLGRLSDEAFGLIAGSTDSEHMFALFTDHYRRHDQGRAVERLAAALSGAIAEVEDLRREAAVAETSQLNLAVTDGTAAVVSRFSGDDAEMPNSLYVHVGRRYVCRKDFVGMLDPDVGRGAVIVSSERLSNDPGWDRVPPNHLVTVDRHLSVEVRPIETPTSR